MNVWTDGLMARLRLSAKLAVIVALALFPLLALTVHWLSGVNASLRVTREEHEGSRAAALLLDVAVQTQSHRGQTNMLLSGNEAARAPLAQTRERLAKAVAALDRGLAAQPGWGLASEWQARRQALAALAEGPQGADRAAVFAAHTREVERLGALMQRIGEASSLLYDPQPATYFMAEMTIDRLLPWSETLGLVRGQGAGLLARGAATPQELRAVLGRLGLLEQQLEQLQAKAEAIARNGATVPPQFHAALGQTRRFIDAVHQAFAGERPSGDPAAYFASGTQAIEAVVGFQRALGAALATALDERAAAERRARDLALAMVGLAAVLMCLAGRVVLRSITRPLAEAVRVAERVAQGDLGVRIEARGRDEPAQLLRALSRMTAQLDGICRQVRGGSEGIATASAQIAQGNLDLSSRTEAQASALQQTAASMEQLAATVRHNADRAAQANELARGAAAVADGGSRVVDEVVQTMQGMHEASARIAAIIGTIDAIAFQTNVLALNAAVEAARAGAQGRGFAVVAAEVRALAQRAAEAAKEIAILITDSVGRVEQGNRLAEQAGATMQQIDASVRRMAELVGEISVASREQSEGVSQVDEAVAQMDRATQQNAALVEQTAAAAESLKSQAGQLVQAAAVFRLS